MTKISQNDIIEIERILTSHLNPEKGEEIMESIAHYWENHGREHGIISIAKKMLIKNKSREEVVEFTGLKEKTLEELQKQLKNAKYR